MATSTNYNWAEPDNSSLVKNGASDIRTLGNAIDTSLWNATSAQAGKNAVINGGFDIWQRGTTFTSPSDGTYTADRWVVDSGGGTTSTITQQSTGVPTGSRYVMRVAQTGTANKTMAQLMETSTVAPLWGKTVTFSTKVRRNGTMTGGLYLIVYKSATVDAGRGATWTQVGITTVTNANLPTGTTSADWYLATLTIAIPNDATANSLKVVIADTANNPSGAYWEAGTTQLEIGSTATPFCRAGGTIQGELAACQRYYYRTPLVSGSPIYFLGGAYSTTVAIGALALPVPMRVTPTALEYNAPRFFAFSNASGYTGGTLALIAGDSTPQIAEISYTHGSAVLTAGWGGMLTGNGSTAYLALTAEL